MKRGNIQPHTSVLRLVQDCAHHMTIAGEEPPEIKAAVDSVTSYLVWHMKKRFVTIPDHMQHSIEQLEQYHAEHA